MRASSLRVLAIAIGVLASVLMARFGGPDVKGVASAFAAANVLAYTLVAFDLPQQVLREARERSDPGIAAELMMRSWPYYGLLGAVVMVSWWLFGAGGDGWLLLGSIAYLGSAHLGVAANGASGPMTTAVGAVLQQVGMTIMTVATHLTVGLSPDTAKLVVVSSYLVSLPYFLWAVRKAQGPIFRQQRLSPPRMAGFIRKGMRWQPARAAQFLLLRLDLLACYVALGASSTGIYSVGLSTASLASLVPAQYAANATFLATNGHTRSLRADLRGALTSGLITASLLAAVGSLLIPALYGQDFAAAYVAQVWASPGVVAYGGLQVVTNHLRIVGSPKEIAIPSFLGLCVMVAGIAITVQQWGIAGLAGSSSAGACVALGFAYLLLRKRAATSR